MSADGVTRPAASQRGTAYTPAADRLDSPPAGERGYPAGVPKAVPVADSEEALLRRAQEGDRPAFGQFVTSTQDRLYTLLVRIVGDRDEARELAQEAYLKALAALSSFRGSAAPYTWLYRIAVNLAVARLRKVRRQRTFSLDGGTAPSSNLTSSVETPEAAVLRREQEKYVVAALGRLDSEYRAVLVMRDVDGLDYKEISDVLELPLGTVKSRLFRARLALREEINRYLNPERKVRGRSVAEGGLIP